VRRSAPRPLAGAVAGCRPAASASTALGAVQRVWREVAGDAIAAEAQPIGERRGVVTIGCRSAVWAQELDLMGADLVARLNAAIGEEVVRSLRCVATGA